MILDSPFKRRDDIQQVNKEPVPKSNGSGDSALMLEKKVNPITIQPIQMKIFPAKVNDSEMFVSFATVKKSESSSKIFSCSESSFIFLILCLRVL